MIFILEIKKVKFIFIIELKHREPMVFDQGRPQLAGELFVRFVMIGTVAVLQHGFQLVLSLINKFYLN